MLNWRVGSPWVLDTSLAFKLLIFSLCCSDTYYERRTTLAGSLWLTIDGIDTSFDARSHWIRYKDINFVGGVASLFSRLCSELKPLEFCAVCTIGSYTLYLSVQTQSLDTITMRGYSLLVYMWVGRTWDSHLFTICIWENGTSGCDHGSESHE